MLEILKDLLRDDAIIYLILILIPLAAAIALLALSSGEEQIGKRKDGKYDTY